jgi:phage regulator Rha-like protein
MKELNLVNGKMTTLEFAELTGTMHKHVLHKARNLLKDLNIDSAEFSAQFKDSSGKGNIMLTLNKDY